MTNVEKIFALLEERGIKSKSAFAQQIGLNKNALSDWKTGKAQPSLRTLEKISKFFNLPISYFSEDFPPEDIPNKSQISVLTIPEEYKNIPVAWYEGVKDLTQEDIDEVTRFIEFLKEKNKKK